LFERRGGNSLSPRDKRTEPRDVCVFAVATEDIRNASAGKEEFPQNTLSIVLLNWESQLVKRDRVQKKKS